MYDEVYAVLNPLGAVEDTFKKALKQIDAARQALPDLQKAVGNDNPEFNRSIQFGQFEDRLLEAIRTAARAQDQAADVHRLVWNSSQKGA